jgi:hypothetical protein
LDVWGSMREAFSVGWVVGSVAALAERPAVDGVQCGSDIAVPAERLAVETADYTYKVRRRADCAGQLRCRPSWGRAVRVKG